MSSIMDQLRTLQGKRAASQPPGDSGLPPVGGPDVRAPARGAQRARRYGLMIGVLVGFAVLGASLVVFKGGAPTPVETRPAAAEAAQPSGESGPGVQLALALDLRDTAPEPAEEPPSDPAPSVSLEPVEEAAPEPVEEAPPEPPEEAASEPVGEAPPEPEPEVPSKAPVRVLSQAEHEANMAAIRGLQVVGVLDDGKGIGVYTSEGELRAGGQFDRMDIAEVTLRYVVFESGNKRYKWMLPR